MSNLDEENNLKIEEIFKEQDLKEINLSSNPTLYVFDILDNFFKKNPDQGEYDSNMLMAMSEFHVNNYLFLKEKFRFPENINAKLMNILSILLNLKDKSEFKGKSFTSNFFMQDADKQEINFSDLSKAKIREVKLGLIKENLIPRSNQINQIPNNFSLQFHEVSSLLDYLNIFYLPFFKLYYHFVNIERITDNKKINVIINKPLPVPPLSHSMKQIDEKYEFEETQEAKRERHESLYNNSIDNQVNGENIEEAEKSQKVETTDDDLRQKIKEKNNFDQLLKEKIGDLKKEVQFKVNDLRKADEKVKEVEEIYKKKK